MLSVLLFPLYCLTIMTFLQYSTTSLCSHTRLHIHNSHSTTTLSPYFSFFAVMQSRPQPILSFNFFIDSTISSLITSPYGCEHTTFLLLYTSLLLSLTHSHSLYSNTFNTSTEPKLTKQKKKLKISHISTFFHLIQRLLYKWRCTVCWKGFPPYQQWRHSEGHSISSISFSPNFHFLNQVSIKQEINYGTKK